MRKCLLFQAHCDDGCLSAGQFISGRPDTTVVTVFAGYPPEDVTLTPYDELCGFSTSEDAISARRAEDTEALAYLKATSIHLDHLDSQYGKQDRSAIVADINRLIDELDPELVMFCVGVLHPDHMLVSEAVLEAMRGRQNPLWAYEDLPNSVLHPEALREALDEFYRLGFTTELGFIGTGSEAEKLNAVWNYRSQMNLPDFANRHCFLVPERFHLVKAVTPEERS